MPIAIASPVRVFEQEEFHAVDREVMAIVFEVHNDFGPLLDEELFKREIASRWKEKGISAVEREVRIRVTHTSFAKDYFMDLVFAGGVMVEAKTVETLAPVHRSQSLNYLFLAGLKHGRLLNLRTERVQHEFVSTQLNPTSRRRFTLVDAGWRDLNQRSAWLKTIMVELLTDWGAFLEIGLYREALVHFLGGEPSVSRQVDIFSGERSLGTQRLNLLCEGIAFTVTAVRSDSVHIKKHFQRLLSHTRLDHVQWINLNRHQIEFATLSRNG